MVGAYQDDDQGADSGSAYVFVRSGGAWSQQAKLLPSDGTDGDYFGYSVALAGETALVGAYQDDDQGTSSGSAYVFVRSGGAWSQQAKLLPTDGTDFYYFGHAVALAGETALVGGESVYIFERSGGAWSQQAKLLPNDGAGGAFGYSVALAGETALVGAYQDNDQGTSSGSAYVFVRSSGVWSQQAKLLPSDGAASDYFGYSVALAGETALVGAYGDDDQGTDSGSAYVFVRSGGSWSQQAKLLPSDGAAADLLANSVALWGEIALIGAYADDDQGGNSGSAYVFVRSGGSWSQQAKLLPSNGSSHGAFGLSVALSDGIALAGSPNNDASGSVYVVALKLDLGAACPAVLACASGFCVDGVCCNSACTGDCEACSIAAGAPTDGACAPLTGPICNDGDACTQTDTCQTGVCVGSSPVSCPPPDVCHLPGACSSITGQCTYDPRPAGTVCAPAACSDAMLEVPDQCDGQGTCLDGGSQHCGLYLCAAVACPTNCAADTDCIDDAYCRAGACEPKKPFGASCTATNECLNAQCLGGICTFDTDGDGIPDPIDNCPQQPNPSQADANQDGIGDACDCSTPPKPDGASCYDGELCTQEDTCQSGICVSGAPVTCPDVAVCIAGHCDSASGACMPYHKLEGTPCVEGGESGTCIAGGCFIEQPNGAGGGSSTGGGSIPASSGGTGGGSGGNDPAGSGAGAGAPSGASPGSENFLRLHGNGCAASGTGSAGGGAFGLLLALLLATRRAAGAVAPTARASSRHR